MAAKKNIGGFSPAEVILNNVSDQESIQEEQKKKGGRPKKDVTRNVRFHVLLTPELSDDIKTIAKIKNRSMNDMVFEILKQYVRENKKAIIEDFKDSI